MCNLNRIVQIAQLEENFDRVIVVRCRRFLDMNRTRIVVTPVYDAVRVDIFDRQDIVNVSRFAVGETWAILEFHSHPPSESGTAITTMARAIERELRRLLVRSETAFSFCRFLLYRFLIKLSHDYVSAC